MDASGEPEDGALETPRKVPRKAARWSWPLILFSIIPLGILLERLPVDGEVAAAETVVAVDPAELAILKMQAQVVIASQKFEPGKVELMLEDLSGLAESPGAIAGLALIEKFVLPDSDRAVETVKKLPADKMPITAQLVEKAVESGLNDGERAQLQEVIGEWYASLAPAEGGEESPSAGAIRTRSIVVFMVGSVCFLCALAGLIAGGVLVIIHANRMNRGMSVNALKIDERQDGVYLECFALYLGVMSLGSLGAELFHPALAMIAFVGAVIVPLVWPIFRKVSWKAFRHNIGWHRGEGFFREVGAGIVGYFGVLSIASIGITITALLMFVSKLYGDDPSGVAAPGPEPHPIVGWIFEGSILVKLGCLFLASVFAPFFEETFFRGMFHRYLRGRFGFLVSALIGGLIFAVLHPQGFYAVPALAAMGVGFALIREWRDSLIAPMVAHAINNGVLVFALWATL
ncbi:type II CAAX endopeptidase family protein [Verrucomicrobiales bacterium BCK34]|nr:type II CAAX endopeptidase family protein [Verrucomicrobiales bacterium BCK34]